MSRRVPPHRSLVVRLLGTSVLIVVLSVATAAWLAAKTATRAVQQERGQSLAGDSRIYDTLLGFAATHPDWTGVASTVHRLERETGRRIGLATTGGRPVAGTVPPGRPDAVLDPLGATIDPRAAGPYQLSEPERTAQRAAAQQRLDCLREQGVQGTVDQTPTGRSVVRLAGAVQRLKWDCGVRDEVPVRSELVALKYLQQRVDRCTRDRHLSSVDVHSVDFTWQYRSPDATGRGPDVQDCVDRARRDQLRPYVAAPARLYLSSPARPPTPVFDLSAASTLRIAGATAFVLIIAVTATLLVGMRLVRPLRVLTAAADRAAHRPVPVPVSGNDEIGRLAVAFNDLAARGERSEQQRRTMVNDIAHELRSPLTNIRNWLRAGRDGLAEVDQDLVHLLLEESGLLQHIVDDLADLADADAGTLALHRGEHAVGDLLVQVSAAHRGAAGRAGVGVHLAVAGGPAAFVDPVRFRQIVGNLLGNAIRHTPAGGRVDVRARTDGGDLLVAVADTGEGIAAADLPHVFDRFWRADRARTRASGGSGLGLSIARKLVQAHGGELTVVSTPGRGSTFTVRIPSAAADQAGSGEVPRTATSRAPSTAGAPGTPASSTG